jgi:hypothetical protein
LPPPWWPAAWQCIPAVHPSAQEPGQQQTPIIGDTAVRYRASLAGHSLSHKIKAGQILLKQCTIQHALLSCCSAPPTPTRHCSTATPPQAGQPPQAADGAMVIIREVWGLACEIWCSLTNHKHL